MSNLIGSKKGITMVEVIVSVAILSIGILALLTLLPSSWRLAGRSDYLGRASGVLANQIQLAESMVLNPGVDLGPLMGAPKDLGDIRPSGQGAGVHGDMVFHGTRTVTDLGSNAYLVTVNITWTGNATGIRESLRVVRQENYRQ